MCKIICCQSSFYTKLSSWINYEDDNVITLAIGDGANDVSNLIQSKSPIFLFSEKWGDDCLQFLEAHIWNRLVDRRSTEAVPGSDYSIGQFRYLDDCYWFIVDDYMRT